MTKLSVGMKVCVRALNNSYLYPGVIIRIKGEDDSSRLTRLHVKPVEMTISNEHSDNSLPCSLRSPVTEAKLLELVKNNNKRKNIEIYHVTECYDYNNEPVCMFFKYDKNEILDHDHKILLLREWSYKRFVKVVCGYNDFNVTNVEPKYILIDY